MNFWKDMKWIDMLFVLYYSIVPSWMQWDRCHECIELDQSSGINDFGARRSCEKNPN
jgi:hypothetical protein